MARMLQMFGIRKSVQPARAVGELAKCDELPFPCGPQVREGGVEPSSRRSGVARVAPEDEQTTVCALDPLGWLGTQRERSPDRPPAVANNVLRAPVRSP